MAAGKDDRQPSAVQASFQARFGHGGWQAGPGRPAWYAQEHSETGRSETLERSLMDYVVILEKGKKSFGAYVPDLPGCVAVGKTKKEALRLIREAIEFHIEGMRADGLPIPEPSSSTELVSV